MDRDLELRVLQLTDEWEVSLPDTTASAFDALLAETNRAARSRSRQVLGGFLSDLGFLDDLHDAPRRFDTNALIAEALVGLGDLEVMFDQLEGALDHIRVYHDFERVSMSTFLASTSDELAPGVINSNRLLAGLRNGYTFNLISVDRRLPIIGELAEHLERLIGGSVVASVFLCAGAIPSTPLHVDVPELLVIPIRGTKYWEVHRSPVRYPLRQGNDVPATNGPTFAGDLRPGDALAVPRSWVHRAETRDEFSICLTLGLYRTFGLLPVVAAANTASQRPELRRPLTVTAAAGVDAALAALEPAVATFRHLLDEQRVRGEVARELAAMVNRVHGPPSWELAGVAHPRGRLDHRSVRARHVGLLPARPRAGWREPSRFAIAVSRRVVDLPSRWLEVVVACLSGRTISRDELAAVGPGSAEALAVLLTAGLLETVHPATPSFDALCGFAEGP